MGDMTHEQGEQRAGRHAEAAQPQDQPTAPAEPAGKETQAKQKRTRASMAWATAIVALVLLVFLLIFILQNMESARVDFLGFSGSLPLAVAMLFSAIGGAGLVALLGVARMIQLRKAARANRKAQR